MTWVHEAVRYREQGQLPQAQQAYTQACAQTNAPAELWFNLGNVCMDRQLWDDAQKAFERALVLDSGMAPAALQLARSLVHQKAFMSAREAFAVALRLTPDSFSAWLEAGHLCRQMGEPGQALAAYHKAVGAAPERWEGHLALARLLEEQQQWPDAALAYDRAGGQALQHQQAHAWRVHALMGRYRMERGDVSRALEALNHALLVLRLPITHSETDAAQEVLIDVGEAYTRMGARDSALLAFTQASGAQSAATLTRLAEVAYRYNFWQEATEVLRRNVQLRPEDVTAQLQLAQILSDSWRVQEAQALLDAVEQEAQNQGQLPLVTLRMMRAQMASRMGHADAARVDYQALLAADPKQQKLRSMIAMSSLYSDQLSPQEVAQLHRDIYADMGFGAQAQDAFGNRKDPARTLRIGLVTADFHHQHPVNIFMQPVLREWLSRRGSLGLHITVYFTGVSYDAQTELARTRVDSWVEVTTLSDTLLRKRIMQDQIDILMDLAGHTGQHRMGVFAQRAAPLQMTFLGYPGSTGVPNIDWLVGDPVVTPEHADDLCSERVYRLPGTVFCYAPEEDYPSPIWTDEHLTRPLTLASFNNLTKATPRTLSLWAQVLKALPDARLVLKSPTFQDALAVQAYQQRLAALGIAAERVEFRGASALQEMMAEYGDVDIALDSLPYNGGTTTLQALWMGVPVLTMRGNSFVSRMGQTFMTAVAMSEWVADSDEAFVQTAVRMASDRHALLAIKQSLRERLRQSPAGDMVRYAQNFATMLREVWQDHC